MSDRTRRDALKIAAATLPVLPVLHAQEAHQHPAQPAAKPKANSKTYTARALTAEEFETLAQLVELIIPRTDTPGARDANVHVSIDKQCAANKLVASQFKKGIARIDGIARKQHRSPFAKLTEPRQVAILQTLSEEPDEKGATFFRTLKNFTIEAYYTSEEGLTQELQWDANTFVADFKGCTHKEHQS